MAETSALLQLLRNIDCFSALDDASLRLLGDQMKERLYNADTLVCEEGELGDWMFVIASGELRVITATDDGGAVQVGVLGAGEAGGMQSLFEEKPRSATLRARGPVRLWTLDHATLRETLESNTGMAMPMLGFMSRRMRQVSGNLASALQYVDTLGLRRTYEACSPQERLILDTINQKIMNAVSLDAVMLFLFDSIRKVSTCDRLGLAFLEDDGNRVVAYWQCANYQPLVLTKGFTADMKGRSLEDVLRNGEPRVINDLEQHLKEHPDSTPTKLLVQEGIRSNMTCPLIVEGRAIGFLFHSARTLNAYDDHQVALHQAIATRLSQAVDKAHRIEQLTAANQAYFETLGFVSHELKSPLSSIVMSANLLTGGYLGELEAPQQEKIEAIIRKSRYLLDLIGEYLNLARLEGGQLEPHLRDGVDLAGDITDTAMSIVMPQLEEKGMRLTRLDDGSPLRVRCAPDLMQIVMINLLSNAIKYGHRNGEIRLDMRLEEGHVIAKIWNEGPGFPKEEQGKLFRKFSRVQTPELLERKGTGIGLYTTWRIIQSHCGTIRAHSELGEWAEFVFEIPVLPENTSDYDLATT
jgi:signal transduction histidine kinase/CRP-like cAMP-binding protein